MIDRGWETSWSSWLVTSTRSRSWSRLTDNPWQPEGVLTPRQGPSSLHAGFKGTLGWAGHPPGLGLPTSPHTPGLGLWDGPGTLPPAHEAGGLLCVGCGGTRQGAGQRPAFLEPPGPTEGKAHSGLPHPFSPSSNAVVLLKSPSGVSLQSHPLKSSSDVTSDVTLWCHAPKSPLMSPSDVTLWCHPLM